MLSSSSCLASFALVSMTVAQKVYMCGDSTMAQGGGGGALLQGWGATLSTHLTLPVTNVAKGGRSARSFTVESRFSDITKQVQKGDYVIISFGKNDGGSLQPTDNLRSPCPGTGSETCTSTNPSAVTPILTYSAYLQNAGDAIVAAGGNVIFASPTPNNLWETGTFTVATSRFTTYMKAVAGSVRGAVFVDHGAYWMDVQKSSGKEVVDAWYPVDHTHPSIAGAKAAEEAFVRGLGCVLGKKGLAKYISGSVEGAGTCL